MNECSHPFSAKGFGARMRKWCDAANLPQCSSHGLRKAISRKLAEAGATAPEIRAVIGDIDLKAIEVYFAKVNNALIATNSVANLKD